MKELPKMYRNKIEKELTNNERIYSSLFNGAPETLSRSEIKEVTLNTTSNKNNYTVEQKIANIFNSPNYIYKIDVIIVTDQNKSAKRIVGKTKTNLITMDNEYIPINTIRDIYMDK